MIFCSLYSGSSGNSLFVSTDQTKILIDAGLPGKSIETALQRIGESPANLDGIFITHEHSDHIKGVGVLSRKYNIPVFARELTWKAMKDSIGNVKDHNIQIIDDTGLNLKDMDILNFRIPHDAADPGGYAIIHNNKKVCIATDLGYFSEEVHHTIKDADVILLECNHDIEMLKFGPYPYALKRRILSNIGHLSNEDCGKAIVDIIGDKYKRIILGHLSQTNNYPALAYQTVLNILDEEGVQLDKDLTLTLAKRDMPSNYVEF